jgi:hypothetical protein
MSAKGNVGISVGFGANLEQFRSEFQKARNQMDGMAKQMQSIGGLMKGAFVGGIIAGAKQLKDFVHNAGRAADALLDMRDQTGASLKQLQEYQYISKVAGVELDFFARAVMQMTQTLLNSKGKAGESAAIIKQLGVNTKDASGQMRNAADVTSDLLSELAGMENQTQRNAMAARIFGERWRDLAPVLGLGNEKIKQLKEEANKMGTVLDEDMIQKANEGRIAFDKFDLAIERLQIRIASELTGEIDSFTESISGLIPLIIGAVKHLNTFFLVQKDIFEFGEKIAGKPGGFAASILGSGYGALEAVSRTLSGVGYQTPPVFDETNIGPNALDNSLADPAEFMRRMQEIMGSAGELTEATGAIAQVEEKIKELQERIKNASEDELPGYNRELQILQERLKGLKEVGKIELPKAVDILKLRRSTDMQAVNLHGFGVMSGDMFKRMGPGKTPDQLTKIPGIAETAAQAGMDFASSWESSMMLMATSNSMAMDSLDNFAASFAKSTLNIVRNLGAQAAALALRDSFLKGGMHPIAAVGLAGVAVGAVNAILGGIINQIGGGSNTPRGSAGGGGMPVGVPSFNRRGSSVAVQVNMQGAVAKGSTLAVVNQTFQTQKTYGS